MAYYYSVKIYLLGTGWLHEGFEVPVTGRDASTAGRPLWDDEPFQLLVARSHASVHLLLDEFPEGAAHFQFSLGHAEQQVDLRLDPLPGVKVTRRIILIAPFVLLGESIPPSTWLVIWRTLAKV
jgi:hypothetical protein